MRWVRNLFLGMMLVMFMAPIIVVAGVSFNERKQLPAIPAKG